MAARQNTVNRTARDFRTKFAMPSRRCHIQKENAPL